MTATATDPAGNTSEFSAAIGQLLNISTRMKVLTGNSVLIGGFIIGGSGNKEVLLRALGPTLTQFGVNGVLGDPTLELHDAGALITSNDNWKDSHKLRLRRPVKLRLMTWNQPFCILILPVTTPRLCGGRITRPE